MKGAPLSWGDLESWLQSRVLEIVPMVATHSVPVDSALDQAQEAYLNAINSGLFQCTQSSLGGFLSEWRRSQYHRLLHRLGVVSKMSGPKALMADRLNEAWGPPAADPPAGPGDQELLLGQRIPPRFTRVLIQDVGPDEAKEIGSTHAHLVDWNDLANELGVPHLGATFKDVAKHTKWRRMVLGGGKARFVYYSASKKGGGCVKVLGLHLAEAVVTLTARGEQLLVSRWGDA